MSSDSSSSDHNPNRHLNGITLENLLQELVDHMGWGSLAQLVSINCFRSDPSVKSSLKFLRKTPWARAQVETVYIGFKEGESTGKIRQRLKMQQRPAEERQKKPQAKQKSEQQKKPLAQQKKQSGSDPWAKAKKNNDQ